MARAVPHSLRALGRRELPPQIEVREQSYALTRVFKNDFFAITAMYEGEAGRILLKVNRQAPFLLIPLGWVGRLLGARERTALERLRDVEGVPKLSDRWGPAGLIREYIDGHPLARGERVNDDFHPRLRDLIDTIHARSMAYVDLEKCENVLVGDDGKPYLFDFQISWLLPSRWGGELWPARVLRRWLQEGDLYHLIKLQRRTRPDQLSAEQLAASYRKAWYLRVHHVITIPFTRCRRLILDRIDPRRHGSERGRVTKDDVLGAS